MSTEQSRTNLIRRTTDLAMYLVQAYVRPGDVVIDATCGNGHDTLQLFRMVERKGWVFAFDIQPAAIDQTRELLLQSGIPLPRIEVSAVDPGADGRREGGAGGDSAACRGIRSEDAGVTLVNLGHEHMAGYFREHPVHDMSDGFASAIVFNLGYLPGGDKAFTTRTETTLEAVQDALDLLRVDGLVCITLYSGHPEGAAEKEALLRFAEGLHSQMWHVSYISMPNQRKAPPEILLISRKR